MQAKGTDAATTTGTEAAVYASEASDKNDLLEKVLPGSISDYVALVKAHLSAGKINDLVLDKPSHAVKVQLRKYF